MFRPAFREFFIYLGDWPNPAAITCKIRHKDPIIDQKKLVLKNPSKVQVPYLVFGLDSIPSNQFQPIQVKQIFREKITYMEPW